MPSSTASRVTTDHDEIRRWAEERGAKPVAVARAARGGEPGVRLKLPKHNGNRSLKQIGWDEWFEKFETAKLALLYQEKTPAGEMSEFNEIITRDTAERVAHAMGRRGRSAVHSGATSARSRAKESRSAVGKGDGGTHVGTRSNAQTKRVGRPTTKNLRSARRTEPVT